MKKTAIVITGIANSGKTSTIKKVVEKVIEKIKKEKIEANIQEIKDQILSKEINIEDYTIPKSEKEDISLIISINNNIRIGIESQGDTICLFKKTLGIMKNNNCHIILCAARIPAKGDTYHGIEKTLQSYEIKPEEKEELDKKNDIKQSPEQETINKNSALYLYNKYFESLLNK
ncbi:hypothetical protein [Tannerella forsythia]|uniref:Uncharacterized protein n=1 Tax=Tannerella forsythia TaxID=28112 RepID=A0A3P1XT86_TANFO|nr:hypothetical protein [Tannerella forsythia]RRD61695.1 hypothetical protein EII40_05835 [Tannerella forsythia]